MGYGSFYKGEKKKQRKDVLEKKATHIARVNVVPQVEIIGRKKGK
ncbi:MAG: hypothetical protein UV59_C0030G0002 [Candidatus Gottesmanbacteria bacterium GW2011_GWA1_43_11]|uniref:Uncharacterized protein n=1 Tax=Candidatus Gottesmanbacteria bacterium GW2011_GWA1_43_11 TaxID=1618436 RepID=A0A0G1CEM8_9BACT|nr:MAG: hypothetical protein UV59_C0030G0002 [Candidatus Gottesmanbacteria bacterium GW2011_GWA1_43_11]